MVLLVIGGHLVRRITTRPRESSGSRGTHVEVNPVRSDIQRTMAQREHKPRLRPIGY